MRIPLLVFAALTHASAFAAAAPPDYRFKVDVLLDAIPQPMHLQFAPDGRIFYSEIAGKLNVYDPATGETKLVGEIEVTTKQENGLIGMALDPDFASNNRIYLTRSPHDFDGQVVSRYTITDDKLDMSSRKDLLKVAEQRQQCCHHAGSLRFGPDGNLYFSTGDNTNPFESDGFSPIDQREGRGPWDAQKSSANTNDLRGKLLRIRPTEEGGYEIPEGNLFPPGTPDTRPEIYAMGFRNPWRFQIDPATGIAYVGDVGPDSGTTEEDRGPNGFDTLNQVREPGNFGWPYVRGTEVYHAFDFAGKKPGPEFVIAGPVNASPNNTGKQQLPPVTPPLIWYPHKESGRFPELGTGGRTACGGPVFHFKPEFEKTGGFPAYFDKALLFYDWQRPFLKWVRLDANGGYQGIEDFTGAVRVAQGPDDDGPLKIRRPVDMTFGPDGALYLLDYGETWGINRDARLLRIGYQWGDIAPTAVASAAPAAGAAPLEVTLSGERSHDPEGGELKFEWILNPGGKSLGTGKTLRVSLAEPGTFAAELRVTDPQGGVGTARVPLTVGNDPPTIAIKSPADGDFFTPGEPIRYEIEVRDKEDGSSNDSPDMMGFRTIVTANWTGRDGRSAVSEPGLTLMKQSDCFNCHAVEQTLIGPGFLEIADRYRGDSAAKQVSVGRVINGSAGVWGEVGMLPHPQLNQDEVNLMVSWIYDLKKGKTSTSMSRGLSGEVAVPDNDKLSQCRIEAVYSDAGAPPAGALNATAAVTLSARRIEAESLDLDGPRVMGAKGASGGKTVGAIRDGAAIMLPELNLAQATKLTLRYSSDTGGGKLELRKGSKDGDPVAAAEITNTGGWENWQEISLDLAAVTDRSRWCLVFPGNGPDRMNLDWLRFDP